MLKIFNRSKWLVVSQNSLTIFIGGSGCGSVGRAVASNSRGLQFESSHQQKIIDIEHLLTVNCVLKWQKYIKKRPGMALFKKTIFIGGGVLV